MSFVLLNLIATTLIYPFYVARLAVWLIVTLKITKFFNGVCHSFSQRKSGETQHRLNHAAHNRFFFQHL